MTAVKVAEGSRAAEPLASPASVDSGGETGREVDCRQEVVFDIRSHLVEHDVGPVNDDHRQAIVGGRGDNCGDAGRSLVPVPDDRAGRREPGDARSGPGAVTPSGSGQRVQSGGWVIVG